MLAFSDDNRSAVTLVEAGLRVSSLASGNLAPIPRAPGCTGAACSLTAWRITPERPSNAISTIRFWEIIESENCGAVFLLNPVRYNPRVGRKKLGEDVRIDWMGYSHLKVLTPLKTAPKNSICQDEYRKHSAAFLQESMQHRRQACLLQLSLRNLKKKLRCW